MWPLTQGMIDENMFRLGEKTMELVKLIEIATKSKKLLLKIVSFKTAVATDQSYLFLQQFRRDFVTGCSALPDFSLY